MFPPAPYHISLVFHHMQCVVELQVEGWNPWDMHVAMFVLHHVRVYSHPMSRCYPSVPAPCFSVASTGMQLRLSLSMPAY